MQSILIMCAVTGTYGQKLFTAKRSLSVIKDNSKHLDTEQFIQDHEFYMFNLLEHNAFPFDMLIKPIILCIYSSISVHQYNLILNIYKYIVLA